MGSHRLGQVIIDDYTPSFHDPDRRPLRGARAPRAALARSGPGPDDLGRNSAKLDRELPAVEETARWPWPGFRQPFTHRHARTAGRSRPSGPVAGTKTLHFQSPLSATGY